MACIYYTVKRMSMPWKCAKKFVKIVPREEEERGY
jgi:hypothetical protein